LFPGPSSEKGITKHDLVDYYGEVADTMLPHLKGRALACNGFPAASANKGSSSRISPIRCRTGWPVSTGSRGLHVAVPVRADTDFDTVRQFARDVAEVVVADDAAHRTVEVRKDKRGGRVYLDVMRNAYAQTAVAPYSVRARAGAPVATPLEWDELDTRGLRADRFTIRDLPKRLAGQRDPWADMSRHARSLSGPAQRLAKLRA
jgi:DNA primase